MQQVAVLLVQPQAIVAGKGLLFAIEEQFHISIPDDKARGIKTFADMADIVEQLVPVE